MTVRFIKIELFYFFLSYIQYPIDIQVILLMLVAVDCSALILIPEMLYINEFPVCWFVLGCIYCSCKSSLIPGMLCSWTWS